MRIRIVEDKSKRYEQDLRSVIDILNERIKSIEKEKINFEQKLKIKENKIEKLLQDKETLLKEKSEVLEVKNEILQTISKQELELQQRDQKYSELQLKFKQSSGELLSKSMQIEKLIKKVYRIESLRDSEKQEMEGGIISLDNTGVISNMEGIINYIKETLPQGKSSIRLVLPEIEDLNKFELTSIIKERPSKVRINIAIKIDNPDENPLVQEMKEYSQLIMYNDIKFIALNVDSSNFIIGIFRGDEVIGIYTDILELIDLFKSTIMEPFIKGRKI